MVKTCPGYEGATVYDEATAQSKLAGPAEAAGCGDAFHKYLDCGLAAGCASVGLGAPACKSESDAYAKCRVSKTCGNGICEDFEYGNCGSDCATS